MPEPPPFIPAPDRPEELPLDETQLTLRDCVDRLKPARIRNAARSAFVHLHKAWTLHPTDSEMSLFRAITAEEEAATAVILALRQQGYPGATELNHKKHEHKTAIWPLIEAIGRGLIDKEMPLPKLMIHKTGRPKLSLRIDVAAMTGLDEPLWAEPDHPFNFVMRSDETGPFEIHRWDKEFAAIASDTGRASIRKHIEIEANLRNRILYASDGGIPAVRFPDTVLRTRLSRVTWLITVTIGILQTRTHQLFVVQGLEALLKALGLFRGPEYAFPPELPEGA